MGGTGPDFAGEFTVVDLWRFPVKSLQGERLDAAEITTDGIVGDRAYGIVDDATELVLTARREPRLLEAAAAYRPDGSVTITLPDGSVAADDDGPVDVARTLRAPPGGAARDRRPLRDRRSTSSTRTRPSGSSGTDPPGRSTTRRVRASPSCPRRRSGEWDARRFRANVLLSGAGEEALVGSTVRVGAAELDVGKEIDRCVIVTRPQPGGIDRDLDVLRTIHRERGGNLGIGALVRTPGRVAVGRRAQ